MSNLVKHIKSFMHPEDAMIVCDYARSVDNSFIDFGNVEKEFTFHASFSDNTIKDILDQYGKKVHDFVECNYEGPFSKFDSGKTHIARFITGYGMHEHFDSSRPNDIATLIYLNNDYDGGEIYFPELEISIKPEAGDLICFPDTPDFVHGVKPIRSGTRYTSPRWITRLV